MKNESFLCQLGKFRKSAKGKVPSQKLSYQLLNRLIHFLFPILSDTIEVNLKKEMELIRLELKHLLIGIGYDSKEAGRYTDVFFEELPQIYNSLLKDAEAIYEGDPAAESIEEVVVSYPGFLAVVIYRLAHNLYQQNIPIVPRLFSEYGHKETGIDIHPGATIGTSFCIDHGTGIVIGETAEIGDRVKIYQGVTLGALSVEKSKAGVKRHPVIEDDVTIYAGSTILGGKTVIGKKSVIGGNVWLTESVEPFSVVLNKSEIYVKNKNPEYQNVIDFVI